MGETKVFLSIITSIFEFYLSVPPKITPFNFARDLNVGDRTSIQCVVVTGDLPLSFAWLKDHYSSLSPTTSTTSISTSSTGTTTGTDITTRQYDDFTSTLSIGSITRAHSGNYTCRVSNAAATVTHTAELQVNGNTHLTTACLPAWQPSFNLACLPTCLPSPSPLAPHFKSACPTCRVFLYKWMRVSGRMDDWLKGDGFPGLKLFWVSLPLMMLTQG